MGINVLDLPPSTSEDNINFGDKDSIRRRALQALEGKDDFNSGFRFGGQRSATSATVVEIPSLSDETTTNKASQRPFDLGAAKYSSSSSPFGSSSSLAGKRDSFGKLPTPTSSMKDQLHTLLEEEEEEEGADVETALDAPGERETDVLTVSRKMSYTEKPLEEPETPRSHASSIRSSSSAREPRLFCSSLFRWIDNLFTKRVMYADHTSSASKASSSKRTGSGHASRKLKSARGYSESRKQPRPHSMVPPPCDWTINQEWCTFRPE